MSNREFGLEHISDDFGRFIGVKQKKREEARELIE